MKVLLNLAARLTGRVWFVYTVQATGRKRLYFDKAEAGSQFFSVPWR